MSALLSAATDVGLFAEQVLRRPLWDHQLSLARSSARYRVVCAGRQVGKSTGVAVIALHEATTRAGILVLLVSAGETASKRLLDECASVARGSAVLAGSIVEESATTLVLSNGSRILSVPASEKQIRGWAVDLLVVDEAAFVSQELWRAAEPAIIARPGSRVILLSSPWGSPEHFFRSLWNQGTDRPDAFVESWHWPSTVSPLVDRDLLARLEERDREYYRREYLAEWTDEAGAYFTEAELMRCVADYRMTAPEELELWLDRPYKAAAGIDWGFARDANAIVLLSVLEDERLNPERGDSLSFFIPFMEARHGWPYSQFIDRVAAIGKRYHLPVIASETNGVGAGPTEFLRSKVWDLDLDSHVIPVVTDVRRKMSGFSKLKGLLQRQRIVLPREPELLKQLRSLQFEQLPTGNIRIAVPETLGHDDIAMALMQAVSAVWPAEAVREPEYRSGWGREPVEFAGARVTTSDPATGEPLFQLPAAPRPVKWHDAAYLYVQGAEGRDPW